MKKLNSQQRVEYFELLLVRLLHTLAHHPDFSTAHEDLLDLSKYVVLSSFFHQKANRCRYIQFYLDLIATSENVSLLYHLATKGKTVRDHTSFAHSEVRFLFRTHISCLTRIMALHRTFTYSVSSRKISSKLEEPPTPGRYKAIQEKFECLLISSDPYQA